MKCSVLAITMMLSTAVSASGAPERLKLLDAFSGQPLANTALEIHSDNGIRCVRAPCPTDSVSWTGQTDRGGYVLVAPNVINHVTSIRTPGFKGTVEPDAERDRTGARIVELFSAKLDTGGPMDLGFSYFKMVDAQSGRAIANVSVRIELARAQILELRTNALGYIFIPMSPAAMRAMESTWATVPGYQRTRLDYGGAFYKTRMKRN